MSRYFSIFSLIFTVGTIAASSPSLAKSCKYVAIDESGNIVEEATGHGPRGCVRAQRRCERRADRSCVPEEDVNTKPGCNYVAIDAGTGDVFAWATGVGPRGCIRAKRRCERRANQSCQLEGNVHTKNCSSAAQAALNETFEFVRTHESQLMNDFNVGDRRATTRRIKRRFSRKINRTRVGCATGVLCRTNQDKRIALHAFGIAGNKIRVCYDKIVQTPNYRFCNLVNTITHEMGHSIGIAKERFGAHGKNQNDRVYQFGDFAETLCETERVGDSNYMLLP